MAPAPPSPVGAAAPAPSEHAARVENTRGVFDACLTNLLFVEYKSIVATMMDAVEPFLVSTFLVGPSGSTGTGASTSTTVVSVVMARTLAALRKYCVPHGFTQQVYAQLCYQLAGTLVNHLLRQTRYCTAENGMRLVLQTTPLVQWLARNSMPQAADQFTILHDVSRLLSTNKAFLAEPNVLPAICPTMSFTLARLIASSCPDTFVPLPFSLSLHRTQLCRVSSLVVSCLPPSPPDVAERLKSMDCKNSGATGEIDVTFVHRLSYDFLDDSSDSAR